MKLIFFILITVLCADAYSQKAFEVQDDKELVYASSFEVSLDSV